MKTPTIITLSLLLVVISGQFITPPFFDPIGGSDGSCCDQNKIIVSGEGTASGTPDEAIIRVRYESKGQTNE